jgi:hypothetical protein
MSGQVIRDNLVGFYRRFVVLTPEQADTLALWTTHTHAFGAAETTPYLGATSAEKRSGKTRALEAAELLVRTPLPTMNISDAALFRAIAKLAPTLLMDEIDAIFSPKARDREDLRGMLNAGYRQGAMAWRMGGANMRQLESFPVFCPKMFAGIGDLPDTIADRTITIRLQRRTRDEEIERFRRRDVEPEAALLRGRIAEWCEPQLDELRRIRPNLPDELDDRAQDCWEPLLAIADLAGGKWPERARTAALTLSTGDAREDDSVRVRLLVDIEQVFLSSVAERYRTADLIDELAKIEESPWGDWNGKTITPQALSKLLKPFQIKTMPVWVDGKTVRGYKREQFENTWLRVLGVRGVSNGRYGSPSDAAPNAPTAPNAHHTNGRFCDACTTPERCADEHYCSEILTAAAAHNAAEKHVDDRLF